MAFFDKKTEVLQVELTEKGVQKLAEGTFSPASYAFFDVDVLYDSEYGGFEQSSNLAGYRIQEETGRVKGGVAKQIEDDTQSLGNSDEGGYAPAWRVQVHSTEFDDFSPTRTDRHREQIPQITCNLEYRAITKKRQSPGSEFFGGFDPDDRFRLDSVSVLEYTSDRLRDETYIDVRGEHLFLEVREENVPFEKENFNVVFSVLEEEQLANGETKEVWVPLSTTDREFGLNADEVLGTYFNVDFDDDIDNAIFCDSADPDYRKGVFLKSRRDCDESFAANDDGFYRRRPRREDDSDGELC